MKAIKREFSVWAMRVAFAVSVVTFVSCEKEDLSSEVKVKADVETISTVIEGSDVTLEAALLAPQQLGDDEMVKVFSEKLKMDEVPIDGGFNERSAKVSQSMSGEYKAFKQNVYTPKEFATKGVYVIHLQALNDELLQSVILTNNEKQSLVNEIALMTSLVDWMEQKNEENQWVKRKNNVANDAQNVQPGDSNNLGWWDSWGKCAADIVGGIGSGGLGGAAVGGVGCTVVLPIIGTVACGVVGGVIGGVSGGLLGAVVGC